MRSVNIGLVIFLFIFPVYLGSPFYGLDRVNFISPVYYGNKPMPIRADLAGDGHFGVRRNGRRRHKGIDIIAKIGEPIYAPLSGRVIEAEHQRGYGNYIEIEHETYNMRTIYAHLAKINVAKNQFVRQGEIIGFVGKTGNAHGRRVIPHLHFEVYKNEKLIDPNLYLDKIEYLAN